MKIHINTVLFIALLTPSLTQAMKRKHENSPEIQPSKHQRTASEPGNHISVKPEMRPRIRLSVADTDNQDTLELPLLYANESLTIKYMLEDIGTADGAIPVHNVTLVSLTDAAKSLEHLAEQTKPENLEQALKAQLAQLNDERLHALFLAASYLDIKPLLDACAKAWGQRCLNNKNLLINSAFPLLTDASCLAAQLCDHHQGLCSWLLAKASRDHSTHEHREPVRHLCFSPNSKILASGAHAINVCHLINDEWISTATLAGRLPITSLFFSLDGKTLVAGSDDHRMDIYNPFTGGRKTTLTDKPIRESIASSCISPDRKILVSGYTDHTFRIWDITDGGYKSIATLTDHKCSPASSDCHISIPSASFSADGKTFVTKACDIKIKIWKLVNESWTCISSLDDHKEIVTFLDFSPDGKTIVSAYLGGILRFWNLIDDSWVCTETLTMHGASINAISFSPCAQFLALGDSEGAIKVYRKYHLDAAWTLFTSLLGHEGCVRAVAFSPDGQYVASGSDDCSIKIWDLSKIVNVQNFLLQKISLRQSILLNEIMFGEKVDQKEILEVLPEEIRFILF